jgi:hypothetical protein
MIYVLFFFGILKHRFPLVLFLEVIVVIVEWGLFKYVLTGKGRSYLLLSLIINSCSFLAGIIMLG